MAKKKLESSFINMVVVLTTVTLIAATALSNVYKLTKPDVEAALKSKTNKALELVLPVFDNKPADEKYKVATDADSVWVFPASLKGEPVGMAIQSYTTKGYAGFVSVLVGMDNEGKFKQTFVLQHQETPGLGTKMKVPSFKDQFVGKSPESFKLSVKKDGGDVDAITAATISTRAFCDALNRAYGAYKETRK